MVCDFCDGKRGVYWCGEACHYICQDCIDAAQQAAWDEIHAEFDRTAEEVQEEVEAEAAAYTIPW